MEGVRFNVRVSQQILLEMWEKWVFLTSAASSTCLMRAALGDICASPGGTDYVLGVQEECRRIAGAEGYTMRDESFKRSRDMLTAAGSTLTASMLRDIERNSPIEADHIVGDLLERGQRHGISGSDSFLKVAYTHLKAYEARRARTQRNDRTPFGLNSTCASGCCVGFELRSELPRRFVNRGESFRRCRGNARRLELSSQSRSRVVSV